MKTVFLKQSFFSVPRRDLFAFHERKDAFSLLTPEFADIETISTASTLQPSEDVVRFNALFLWFKFRFEMIHTGYEKDKLFLDEQKKGLFTSWRHEHRFFQAGWKRDPFSMLSDRIEFAHPLLSFFQMFVKSRLKKMFEYRHEVTAEHVHAREENGQRVVITGATGLIGKRVARILLDKGYQITALVRNPEKAARILGPGIETVFWDLDQPEQNGWQERLDRARGVIHLAGFPLFKKRWSKAVKERIRISRVESTKNLVKAISGLKNKPEVLIAASAVGVYGSNSDETVDESHAAADDFLARLCVGWENETKKAGIRNVQLRIGIVLSREGGALKEMLPMFRFGTGGPMGEKRAWVNWIHLEDMARIVVMSLENSKMQGPYNAVGPSPVTMETFAGSIAKNLRRPCLMRYPVSLLKILIGEAGEYMGGSPKALCNKVVDQGYEFMFKDIDGAIFNLLH